MARRGPARKRQVVGDSTFDNKLISKLINRCMYDGKKSVAQKEVYSAIEIVAKKLNSDGVMDFERAIENIKPEMEVRARRIGGAAYQVPMQVRNDRKESLAIRWLVNASRSRSNSEYHTFGEKLAVEIMDALKGEGGAMKKKQDMERQAEANKAFSHFKW